MNIATTHPAIPLLDTALTALERASMQMATPEKFPQGSISKSLVEAHDAYLAGAYAVQATHPHPANATTTLLWSGEFKLRYLKDEVVYNEDRGMQYRSGDFAGVLQPNYTMDYAIRNARKAVEMLSTAAAA